MDTQTLHTVISVFVFVLGCMVGSFLNVCVYRIPRNLSVVKPRSRCPKCENPIAWYDNFPIVSWLILGAKCRHCGEPISWQYPLVEAVTGALFFFVFWRYGLVVASPIYMALAAGLVLVTFVDLTDWTIPDEVTIPGVFVGIACSVLYMFFPEGGLHVHGPFSMPVFNSLVGALVGGGVLYLLDKLALLLLKKPGMGFGDVKLNAMLGAFFGLYGVLLIIMLASFVGSVFGVAMVMLKKRQTKEGEEAGAHYLPFGPYLALAGVIVMLFGQDILRLYQAYLNQPVIMP